MKDFGGGFGGGTGKGPFGDYNGNGRYDPQDHWLNENYAGTDEEFMAADRKERRDGRRSGRTEKPSADSPVLIIAAAVSCICAAGIFLAASACVSVFVFLETLAWSIASAALSALFFHAGTVKKRNLRIGAAVLFAAVMAIYMTASARMGGCFFGDPGKSFPGIIYPCLSAAGLVLTGYLVQVRLHDSPPSLRKFLIGAAVLTAAAVAAIPLNVIIGYRGITDQDKCGAKVVEILRDNGIYADRAAVEAEADEQAPGNFPSYYFVTISADKISSWPEGTDPSDICQKVNALKTDTMGIYTIIDFGGTEYDGNGEF